MKKTRTIVILILLIVLVLVLSSYITFKMLRIDNLYEDEFKDRLVTTIQEETSFYIRDLTPFHWDKAFMIQPYTSRTEMQKIVGKEWTIHNTYLGYLFEKTIFGEHPLDDDIVHKLVFVNREKVVLDVTILRSDADFRQIDGIIYFNDLLIVNKLENGYPIIHRDN